MSQCRSNQLQEYVSPSNNLKLSLAPRSHEHPFFSSEPPRLTPLQMLRRGLVLDLSIAGGTLKPNTIPTNNGSAPLSISKWTQSCARSLWIDFSMINLLCHELTYISSGSQVSAQHSATYGGTASTFPVSGNEINSTPSSKMKGQGRLASTRAFD